MSANFVFTAILLFFILSWLFISLAIYFIPVIVAYIRRHKNILAITLLTIFLGWTFFGWLAGLLWALNSDIEDCDSDD